jgi:predicted DnaQ family exonuclease/DinG family helicase
MPGIIPDEFVAIDIETTGLNADRDDIIEVAAVLFVKGNLSRSFAEFIRTSKSISAFITALTGISQSDLAGSRDVGPVLADFRAFLADRPLVAHNAAFDIKFLEKKGRGSGLPGITNTVYDSLLLSRLGLPGQQSYKLENLVKAFDLSDNGSHRAEADATSCGRLFVAALTAIEKLPPDKLSAIGRLVGPQETDTARLLKQIAPVQAPAAKKRKRRPAPEPLVAADEPREIAEGEIGGIFGGNGMLSQCMPGYEARAGQLKMAQAVRRAFNNRGILAVEAGTGTGKSLAYLVAAVLYAVKNRVRVVISTKTKQLQDQIFHKEIPFLRRKLGLDFRAAVLKGRSNYLCLRKWHEAVGASGLLLRGWEADEMLPLILWVEETDTGDISECMGFNEKENRILWARLCSDALTCSGSRCPFFGDCFLMRKRREAQGSHVVLINHSLFFTNLKSDGTVLGHFARAVFDEAHSLVEIGRRHLGDEISHLAFSTALQKLHKKEGHGFGLLRYLGALLKKADPGQSRPLLKTLDALQDDVAGLESDSVRFFREIGNALKKQKTEKLRYKAPLLDIVNIKARVLDATALIARLKGLLDGLRAFDDPGEEIGGCVFDIAACIKEIEGLNAVLSALLKAQDDARVFWAEVPGNPLNLKLYGVPLEISDILGKKCFKDLEAAVLTSATLAVGGDLDYYCRKTGLAEHEPERTERMVLDTLFQFDRQLLFGALRSVQAPDHRDFPLDIAAALQALSARLKKRMLVLFTSRDMLKKVHAAASPAFLNMGVTLLAQDISGSGHMLLEEMKKRPGTVLLGTDTFWEGIDLPGDHLEVVVIARLPFSVPTDPIVAARAEQCEKNGESAFAAFYLPEAVIRFRQGIGRLIRRRDDFGAVVVLDGRLLGKSYGKIFIRSVEAPVVVYNDAPALYDGVEKWFKTRGLTNKD